MTRSYTPQIKMSHAEFDDELKKFCRSSKLEDLESQMRDARVRMCGLLEKAKGSPMDLLCVMFLELLCAGNTCVCDPTDNI